MQFTIKEYLIYQEAEILNLYDRVGWTNYTSNPSMLANAYQHSLKIWGAYDGEKLVDIIRVVGDGYSMSIFRILLYCRSISGKESALYCSNKYFSNTSMFIKKYC